MKKSFLSLVETMGDILKDPRLSREDMVESRQTICEKCEFYKRNTKRCGVCGCYMVAKWRCRGCKCPKQYW